MAKRRLARKRKERLRRKTFECEQLTHELTTKERKHLLLKERRKHRSSSTSPSSQSRSLSPPPSPPSSPPVESDSGSGGLYNFVSWLFGY